MVKSPYNCFIFLLTQPQQKQKNSKAGQVTVAHWYMHGFRSLNRTVSNKINGLVLGFLSVLIPSKIYTIKTMVALIKLLLKVSMCVYPKKCTEIFQLHEV